MSARENVSLRNDCGKRIADGSPMRIKRTIKRVVPGIDRAHEEAKYQEGPPPSPPDGVIVSPDTTRDNRLPPGQARTRKWPILDAFGPPEIDLDQWLLEIVGLVEHPVTFTLEEFKALPRVKVFADMHCVTRSMFCRRLLTYCCTDSTASGQ